MIDSYYLYSTGLISAPSIRPPLALEDEQLLRDDEAVTPVKKDGIRRKDRPTDKGVAWLVKTQYISPISMESAKLVIDLYLKRIACKISISHVITNWIYGCSL